MASVYIVMENEVWENSLHSAWANEQDAINHRAKLDEIASAEGHDVKYWIKEMVLRG